MAKTFPTEEEMNLRMYRRLRKMQGPLQKGQQEFVDAMKAKRSELARLLRQNPGGAADTNTDPKRRRSPAGLRAGAAYGNGGEPKQRAAPASVKKMKTTLVQQSNAVGSKEQKVDPRVQRGPKGGCFVVTQSGEKRYVGKDGK